MKKIMVQLEFNLIVLKSSDVLHSLAFYEAFGLSFKEEIHNSGIVHYACNLGTMTIEIYPGTDGIAPNPLQSGATMLGFRVASIDDICTKLQEISDAPLPTIQPSPGGRRAILTDPDGRKVELVEL
jgi:predicted enzyme related to lactoylglutathione lyase